MVDMVATALRGGSSNHASRLRRLAAALPALLRRRPHRAKPAKQRQTQRRLTPEQVEQLIAGYQGGDDMTVLATRWDLHRTTVAAHLTRAGVELRRQGVPPERIDEASRLYGEGWSLQRLAERFHCDDKTVRQALQRPGVRLQAPWERR
jgi:lambda repressor-like predicted transcriptional regulator